MAFMSNGNLYKLVFEPNGKVYRYLNGELNLIYSNEVSKTKGPVNTGLNLFRRANNTSYARVKILGVKTAKFNFIPLIRLSDGKPFGYDSVSKSFYPNLGTGEFGYEKLDGTYVAPV